MERPDERVYTLPFPALKLVVCDSLKPAVYDGADVTRRLAHPRKFDLLFVASGVPLNVRGISWFHEHVYLPYLRRHKVRLAIAGNVCRHFQVQDAYIHRLFRIEGSLRELYAKAKIVIVPIFEGTGLSIKTLEGLAMGRAVITTPVGSRGLGHGRGAFVQIDMRADPRGTADAVLELLEDSARREQLERSAMTFVGRYFSREACFAALDQAMQRIGLVEAAAPARLATYA